MGGGEVIWTKSKRTATVFRETFPEHECVKNTTFVFEENHFFSEGMVDFFCCLFIFCFHALALVTCQLIRNVNTDKIQL